MAYNSTIANMTNVTNFVDLGQHVSDVTGGWFGPVILLGFFITIVASMSMTLKSKSMSVAAFLSTLLSMFLFALNWLDYQWIILSILATVVFFVWDWISE